MMTVVYFISKGQFNFAEVVVEPRPRGVNVVTMRGRSEMQRLVSGDPVFVSDPWLPQLVRQKALQADVSLFQLLFKSGEACNFE